MGTSTASSTKISTEYDSQHSKGAAPDFSKISLQTIAFVEQVFDQCLKVTEIVRAHVQSADEPSSIREALCKASEALCKQRHLVEVQSEALSATRNLKEMCSGESEGEQENCDHLHRVVSALCKVQSIPAYASYIIPARKSADAISEESKAVILTKIDNLRLELKEARKLLCPTSPGLTMPAVSI